MDGMEDVVGVGAGGMGIIRSSNFVHHDIRFPLMALGEMGTVGTVGDVVAVAQEELGWTDDPVKEARFALKRLRLLLSNSGEGNSG